MTAHRPLAGLKPRHRRAPASPCWGHGQAQQAFAVAVGLFRDGRADEALDACNQVLRIDADHVGAHHLSASIHHGAGRSDQALVHLEHAVMLAPEAAALHNDLGVVARAVGDAARAAHAFAQATGLDPTLAEAHNNLGTVHHARGEPDKAAQAFAAAIHHRPDYINARYNLGAALQAARHPEAALVAFQDLLTLAPDHIAGRFELATVLVALGREAEASTAFERVLASDPADPFGARARLAALGRGPTPSRTSLPQLLRTYRGKADTWDRLSGYLAARLVATTAAALPRRAKPPEVLDIGCGTGLVAEALSMDRARLVGVDLSPEMLAHARAKGLYDALYEADLETFMTGRPDAFDLVIGAAVLIHFGDLGPVLCAVAGCLRPGGRAVFTLLDHDAVNPLSHGVARHPQLLGGGCFAHGTSYLTRTVSAAGLMLVELRRATHEGNAQEAIPGLVVTIAKP
ncbi:tetratricopeptide repeat protein [Pseudomonas aeruginosa]|uniref:tetratricopeptide repeat protein n=1 Tax=Pseudomonas aeruginosa TaxID=287 RepID=UPI002453230F|nr:tetratricopeptide repeat protein [Pseudomonas aeruginosa]MDH4699368.1 tetratricopeptide repeat protein [Pseudomonas aeruginosa]MDH4713356.1 tetratricopeptide repeat protein [Pseudomonas aeruginosa]MDH4723856.1 tetratricopeptide repeat protein [Pseudomonas aeruginosa]MDI2471850.1 tetratricopeptide repeat protein [Pseudomonas aeruginosa]WGJ65812.1 tetratricopeptide repeat protein [Pseudomonas aeruginosa]